MYDSTALSQELGAKILREPKGVPDVILLTRSEDTSPLFQAAAILAVQGYTARLIKLYDEALFLSQREEYRDTILPQSRKATTLFECKTPQETAQEAKMAILSALQGVKA